MLNARLPKGICSLAALDVWNIGEPTAALGCGSLIVVFDLGEENFDGTIQEISFGVFEVGI